MDFIFQEVLPHLIQGLWVSIALIIPSALFGIIIGIIVGSLRVYAPPALKKATGLYVLIFRGFPLIVQLYIWYFGMPHIGVFLSPFAAAVTGFSLCSGAYHSEYVRGAIQSIKSGQMQAAEAMGFSKIKAVLYIILPQAFRRTLPGSSNEFIYLIKYSSLAYMVTCLELTGEGKVLASLTFRYTEVFLMVGVIYLLMNSIASFALKRLEIALEIPGWSD